MPIDRLQGVDERPVTVGQLNHVIEDLNGSIAMLLSEVAGLARACSSVVVDSSTGTSVNEVAAVPVAYSQSYFEETIATILARVNDLVRVNARLAAYAG